MTIIRRPNPIQQSRQNMTQKLFITGALSFIGKELTKRCEENGIEYIGIDLVASEDGKVIQGDINDAQLADTIPSDVDVIVHLAALSRDSDCKNRGYDCFQTNVMGTLNLMNAAQEKGISQFIFASSEWVYTNFENNIPKTEESEIDIVSHTSEYALSKLISENNLRQKYQHGFCDVTILRFGIIYGPRKANWSAVEAIFNTVEMKDEVTVGSLNTSRRFVHVSDICDGILSSVGLKGFNVINLQGKESVTLGEIVSEGLGITKKKVKVVEASPDSANVRLVSNDKAKRILNWEAKISIRDGLNSLVGKLR
jgi:nucleoside-diphosphate-sugar epimerase